MRPAASSRRSIHRKPFPAGVAVGVIRLRSLSVSFSDMQRNGLGCLQPLVLRKAMDTIQFPGILEHPGNLVDGQAVNVRLFVSQGHILSICLLHFRFAPTMAIPISIWIIFSPQTDKQDAPATQHCLQTSLSTAPRQTCTESQMPRKIRSADAFSVRGANRQEDEKAGENKTGWLGDDLWGNHLHRCA